MTEPTADRWRELAPGYVLGALDAAERADFETALERSPALRNEVERLAVVTESLATLVARTPPDGLEQRLLERVRGTRPPLDLTAIDWQTLGPDSAFMIHWLGRDVESGAFQVLLKGMPGARYPDHRHPGGEQFVVLQGAFADHRSEYRAGDSYRFEPGSEHRRLHVTSAEPCILLVMAGPGGIEWLEGAGAS